MDLNKKNLGRTYLGRAYLDAQGEVEKMNWRVRSKGKGLGLGWGEFDPIWAWKEQHHRVIHAKLWRSSGKC